MYKHIFAAVSGLTVALAFAGCGGDEGGGSTPRACENVTKDPTSSTDNCISPSDACYLEENRAEVRRVGGECATSADCLAFIATPDTPEAQKCVTDCMTAALGGALTVECEICSQKVAACGARHCAAQCVQDPQSAACTACLCTSYPDELGGTGGNCLQDVFGDCAGIIPTDEQVGCTGGAGDGG